MAPLITRGAIIASALSPAMKVWVPHEPKGASMIRRFPQGANPLCLVRFVFSDVSSIKTTRSTAAADLPYRAHHPRRRAAEQRGDRVAPHRRGRNAPAIRLHDRQPRLDAQVGQGGLEP